MSKRKREDARGHIQGIPRPVVYRELFELTFPDVVTAMEVDEEADEEGEVPQDRDCRESDLKTERTPQ